MAGALWGGLIGAGGNSLSQMWGAIAGHKAFSDQKSAIRHLRRREYQDMVFSMKKAGLNPMLASGATPGHSAVSQPNYGDGGDIGGAAVSGYKAGLESARNPSVIGKNIQEGAAARTKSYVNVLQERVLNEQLGLTSATTAKTQAETNESLARTGGQIFHNALMEAQAKREGWSAKTLERELEGRIGGNITSDPVGYGTNVVKKTAASAGEAKRWVDSLTPDELNLLSGQPARNK